MGITSSTGIGSGIDINTLVSQLVSAEGQPTYNAIQRQTTLINTHLSGLGTLKSALSTFETAISKLKDSSSFNAYASTSSDETIVKAVAGSTAAAGSYAVEVTQLATMQKSITNVEFDNSSAVVGTGTLTLSSWSGTSLDITIDSSNNTLSGLRDAINNASGNNFVTASIINVDNGAGTGTISKLVLTARNSGAANGFTITGSDSDGNNADTFGLSQVFSSNLNPQSIAADAIIKVDGQTATRSSNTITDVLQGITLNLQSAKPGTTVNVNVGLDTTAITKTVNDFVTAYNNLHSVTQDLGKYGGSTDGSGTGNGALIGDATLRYVANQVRQNTTNVVSSSAGNYNSLAILGITVDRYGVMSLDSTKLKSALTDNAQAVSSVFSSADGVATRLDAKLSVLLQAGGSFDVQQQSLNKQLSTLSDKKLAEDDRLASLQKSLQKQFIAMDTAVGQFTSTGTFLTNWIKKL